MKARRVKNIVAASKHVRQFRGTHRAVAIAASLALIGASKAAADTYTWDALPGDATVTDGGGIWSNGGPNWLLGTDLVGGTLDRNWVNGSDAVFGGTTSTGGAGGLITVNGSVIANTAVVQAPFGGAGYTFAGTGTITANLPALSTISYGGNFKNSGLLADGATVKLSGSVTFIAFKNQVNVNGPAGHLVMSGSSNLDMQGDWKSNFEAFGGFLTVLNGGTMTLKDNAYLGSYSGAVKVASQIAWFDIGNGPDGGTLNLRDNASINVDYLNGQPGISRYEGRIRIGQLSTAAPGILNITDNASIQVANLGFAENGGMGILNQSGNSLVHVDTQTALPLHPSGIGATNFQGSNRYNISGGTLVTHTRYQVDDGELNIAGTGLVDLSQSNPADDFSLQMIRDGTGANLAGTGANPVVNLAGGTLYVKSVALGTKIPQSSNFNFNGGTLKVAAGSASNLDVLGGIGNAVVYHGGAVIDTNGNDATLSQEFLAPSGSNVLTIPVLNGGLGYYFAPNVQVSGGTLGTGPSGDTLAPVAAIANVIGGVLTSVTIVNPGSYTDVSNLSLSLIGGDGTGAVLGTPTIGADGGGGLTKNGLGTLNLTNANALSLTSLSATGGNLNIGPATGMVNPLTVSGAMTITNAATVTFNPTADASTASGVKTNFVKALSIGSNGLLDIQNHFVSVDNTATPFAKVHQYIDAAYHGGDYAGRGGITSAVVKAHSDFMSVGYYNGALQNPADPDYIGQILGPNSNSGHGTGIPLTQILVRPTLTGDLNGDGKVDSYDVTLFNTFGLFGSPTNLGYQAGDLNGDGVVNAKDVNIFNSAGNFNNGSYLAVTAAAKAASTLTGRSASPAAAVLNPGSGTMAFSYDPATGDVHVNYNGFTGFTGKQTFNTTTRALSLIDILSTGGAFALDSSKLTPAANAALSSPTITGNTEINLTAVNGYLPDGTDLGRILAPGLDPAQLAGALTLSFNYTGSRQLSGGVAGLIVPEPTTLSLLGLGALGLLSRRRRIAARH